jgi:hypothetical protein
MSTDELPDSHSREMDIPSREQEGSHGMLRARSDGRRLCHAGGHVLARLSAFARER